MAFIMYNKRILEFILKTKPKQPLSSRLWFFKSENLSLRAPESKERWLKLDPEAREIYEKCAALDRKRFSFEKKAWLTKLLTLDLESDELTLSDFEPIDIKTKLESLGSMVDLCKDLPKSSIGLKRPREPFSLFIEAYRMQIRDARPEFQFGKHLRECSEAWSKLTEEEKQVFRDHSKRLKEERRQFLEQELKVREPTSLSVDFFNPSKSIHGPCRPSHLLPRLPSPISLWSKACNVPQKDRKALWAALPQSEKNKYEEQHRQLKETIVKRSKELEEKLEHIKKLIREAKEMERIKRDSHLVVSKKAASM